MGKPLGILVAFALAFALAACSDDPAITTGPTGGSATASTGSAAFPVTVTGTNGDVTIDDAPRTHRLALADRDRGPVRDRRRRPGHRGGRPVELPRRRPHHRPVRLRTQRGGDRGYEPDLVVFATEPGDLGSSLEGLGITALQLDAAPDLDVAYDQIEQLGAATGHADESAALVEQMRSDIQGLVDEADPATGTSFYYELDDTFYSATSKTFIGQLFRMLGLENIADAVGKGSGGYPQLSAEYIIESDPDLIFLADTKCCGQSAETVAERPGWAGLTAVTDGGIVPLDEDVAQRWGPRVVDLLEQISDAARGGGERRVIRTVPDRRLSARARATALGVVVLVAAVLIGLLVGPVRIGAANVFRWLFSFGNAPPGMSEQQALILARPAAAEGDRRRAGRRGARGLGSRVPGGVPQPPRRPLPAGRGGGRRARRDDRRRLRPDGSARAHGSDRRLHRRARRRRAGVRARAFEPRGPGHDQPRPRRRRRRLVPDRGPDVPAAAAFRDPPPGLHVDPGRLGTTGWDDVRLALPSVAVAVATLWAVRRLLDVIEVGDVEAQSLGLNVARLRLVVVVAASLATAAAVAVAGLIGFVGLIIPHTVRLMVGGSYRSVLPLSVLFGAAFLILVDTLARTVVAPAEIPIGVITAFIGAPFFIAVLRRNRRAA